MCKYVRPRNNVKSLVQEPSFHFMLKSLAIAGEGGALVGLSEGIDPGEIGAFDFSQGTGANVSEATDGINDTCCCCCRC
ncbi:hypothetical protein BC939DRAFT_34155 [Gamsiella multidivaricata]|uniref:uncharacterized protein n=1 Tax=Gamsiella multidivaricata TaxID=101098 RepID=UPI00221EB67E|nr:uncharacterized protein BC939DRAFT_34155 [Gamsiella multidivaricata]KAI7816656.1 hypothetical protein BC939DRAFT_34155 [Gamsiella multidivaricata]